MQSVIDIPLKIKLLLGYCLAASISSNNTKEPSLCVLIVEWDWHNWSYEHNIYTSHTDNVNFDMGLGTNSTFASFQIAGYLIELTRPYIKLMQEISPRGAMPCWY